MYNIRWQAVPGLNNYVNEQKYSCNHPAKVRRRLYNYLSADALLLPATTK